MSERPVIFLSAVSKELKTARGFAARLLHSMGFDPKDQDMARTEHGSLRGVLRKWIDQSEGVIQLVGRCYGAEPREPDSEFNRCSYTQFEARYARKTGKPVWYFFVGDGFPADAHEPEPQELAALQDAYREGIVAANDLRHSFKSDAELENCIRRIENHLDKLRRAWNDEQRRARSFRVLAGIGIVLLLALGIAGFQRGWWMKKETEELKKGTAENRKATGETRDTAARTEKKVDALPKAVTEAIQRINADAAASGGKETSPSWKKNTACLSASSKRSSLTWPARVPRMLRFRRWTVPRLPLPRSTTLRPNASLSILMPRKKRPSLSTNSS